MELFIGLYISLSADPASKGKIISFDIDKEVFRQVQKPHYYYYSKEEDEEQHYYYESLQVLHECLCICQVHPTHGGSGNGGGEVNKIDIWMLKDYDVMDSWTKLFRVVIQDKEFCNNYFKLLRYNCENGEIVMLKNRKDVIVYNTVNHKSRRAAEKFNEVVQRFWMYYMDYTESLVSLNSATYRAS